MPSSSLALDAAVLDRGEIAAARLWAITGFPYFAAGLFALRPVTQQGLGTLAVDRAWRLYCDPAVVSGWSTPQLGSVMVHEVLHLLRDHAGRADSLGVTDRVAVEWNLACDAEINDDLVEAKLPLPGSPVVPSSLGAKPGRLAEEYFASLRSRSRRLEPADCGSGAHHLPRTWELGGSDSDDEAASGVDPAEADLIRRSVARDVALAAEQPGSVPDGLARWAEGVLQPRVDWRRELGGAIRRGAAQVSGRVDYSYRRRSRRSAAIPEVVLAGLVRPVPEVAVVCDTSGSMGAAELERCLAEVEGIVAGVGLRARRVAVLAVDTEMQATSRVHRASQVRLRGGGGTDMGAGMAAAVALRPRPHVVIVLTDGFTPWPAQPPAGIRVIVGLVGNQAVDPPPAWARAIRIEEAR